MRAPILKVNKNCRAGDLSGHCSASFEMLLSRWRVELSTDSRDFAGSARPHNGMIARLLDGAALCGCHLSVCAERQLPGRLFNPSNFCLWPASAPLSRLRRGPGAILPAHKYDLS
jgi:hypothetical protein